MKYKNFWPCIAAVFLLVFIVVVMIDFEHEHVHDVDCYADSKKYVLACDYHAHAHDDACYSGDVLICQKADFLMHRHWENCYDGGKLVCALPQVWWDYRNVMLCNSNHMHDWDACYERRKVLVDLDSDAIVRIADVDGNFNLDGLQEHQHAIAGHCFELVTNGHKDVLICHEAKSDDAEYV